MAITKDDVRRVAQLARMKLSEAEVAKFELQLGGILNYVSQLNEVNTDGIEPTAQVTGLTNVTRKDDPAAGLGVAPDALLACSPTMDQTSHSLKVPNVF